MGLGERGVPHKYQHSLYVPLAMFLCVSLKSVVLAFADKAILEGSVDRVVHLF